MTRHNIPLGRILGIPIGLDYSWFVIFALLTWMLADSYFPAEFAARHHLTTPLGRTRTDSRWPCWSVTASGSVSTAQFQLELGLYLRPAIS